MVTGECQAVRELAQQQQHHSGEHGDGHLDADEEHNKNHPGKGGLEFRENGAGGAAHELVEIFSPTFPHSGKGPVHTDFDNFHA